MKPRERLFKVLKGEIPDCVPVSPDFSFMIPARRTGKPFWDLFLYNDPPIWEAYIDCAKHFDIDSLMDGYFRFTYPGESDPQEGWETFIVQKNERRIVTQKSRLEDGKRRWLPLVNVYHVADPPNENVPLSKVNLPEVPEHWEPLEGVKPIDTGPQGLKKLKERMGDQGLVGIFLIESVIFSSQEQIFDYYDNPEKYQRLSQQRVEQVEKRFSSLMELDVKPDFLCVGGSGTLVYQTVEMFRDFTFPAVKRAIELAWGTGIPTHVHSCGPEKELVHIFAEETELTVIDPLEIPPMGDCDLAELKRLYGDRIVLKGNLHTTDTMLNGTVQDVIAASKKAIDAAAAGGRFILSTGDQCGRDTPDENLRAMVDTARTYGKYH